MSRRCIFLAIFTGLSIHASQDGTFASVFANPELVSPSPWRQATIGIKIPKNIKIDTDHVQLHGVVIDKDSNRYLVYEPLGGLRTDAYKSLKESFIWGALVAGTCGLARIKRIVALDVSWSLRKWVTMGAGLWALGGTIFLAHAYGKYRDFKTKELPAYYKNFKLTEGHATSLKQKMQLPRHVAVHRLYVQKLNDTGGVGRVEYSVPLFQLNKALDGAFSECNKLIDQLNGMRNKQQLQAWYTKEGVPGLSRKMTLMVSRPAFKPLINQDIQYRRPLPIPNKLQNILDRMGLYETLFIRRDGFFHTGSGEGDTVILPWQVNRAIGRIISKLGERWE